MLCNDEKKLKRVRVLDRDFPVKCNDEKKLKRI
ncbi:MAG: hypothetical protein MjAS7_2912 [Metallosphaera javensis (ex Sakai et al. 2022)]|nr:MAG: hypothetical protein MjAS7_2912 [Metallosphaera javensis (ex Sakai et al. 2022)]